MSNVVSLTDKRDKALAALAAIGEETRASEDLNCSSDVVLGVLQDNFDEGVCIGILGSKVQVSSTMEDVEQVIWLLEEALQDLYKEYPEGEVE